jgi:hypothetical protein
MKLSVDNFENKWRRKAIRISTILQEELRCVRTMGSIVFMVFQNLIPKL